MKAFIIIGVVIAALVGLLLTLRSSRNAGMPGADVLDRAKVRGREQDAKDESDAKDE
jgi:hypothetical protein